MTYDQLKLENQLCFPVYAASRLITRAYQPLLDKLGITYPQYLVLMILWENDGLPVNDIAKKLILNTNTVTPLLKRMEKDLLLERKKSNEDTRKVLVFLTDKGTKLQEDAVCIPETLSSGIMNGGLNKEDLISLKENLNKVIDLLNM